MCTPNFTQGKLSTSGMLFTERRFACLQVDSTVQTEEMLFLSKLWWCWILFHVLACKPLSCFHLHLYLYFEFCCHWDGCRLRSLIVIRERLLNIFSCGRLITLSSWLWSCVEGCQSSLCLCVWHNMEIKSETYKWKCVFACRFLLSWHLYWTGLLFPRWNKFCRLFSSNNWKKNTVGMFFFFCTTFFSPGPQLQEYKL